VKHPAYQTQIAFKLSRKNQVKWKNLQYNETNNAK